MGINDHCSDLETYRMEFLQLPTVTSDKFARYQKLMMGLLRICKRFFYTDDPSSMELPVWFAHIVPCAFFIVAAPPLFPITLLRRRCGPVASFLVCG
jgi:hypothetical protein